jgi:DNA-binding transcriptional MerR regulator
MTLLTIGKLARASHVHIDTIRYYERQGLVVPEARTAARYRLYSLESLRRMLFIRKAQGLGLSLTEIAQLMHFGVDPGATKADVLGLTTQKIEMYRAKIQELQTLQYTLVQVAQRCDGDASPASDCPILEFLYPDEADLIAAMQSGKRRGD